MSKQIHTAQPLPDFSPDIASVRGRPIEATRQALFPMPAALSENAMVPADAIRQAEVSLRAMGFTVAMIEGGAWEIRWPGSVMTVWRHSPVALCRFAHDHAGRYARSEAENADGAFSPRPGYNPKREFHSKQKLREITT